MTTTHAYTAQRTAATTDAQGRGLYVSVCSCGWETPASRRPNTAIAKHVRANGGSF